MIGLLAMAAAAAAQPQAILTIDPVQLVLHRRGRQHRLDMPLGRAYSDAESVVDEVEAARTIFRQAGFRTVDVTDKPIEHIADEVLALTQPAIRTIEAHGSMHLIAG